MKNEAAAKLPGRPSVRHRTTSRTTDKMTPLGSDDCRRRGDTDPGYMSRKIRKLTAGNQPFTWVTWVTISVCSTYRIYPFDTFEFFCSCVRGDFVSPAATMASPAVAKEPAAAADGGARVPPGDVDSPRLGSTRQRGGTWPVVGSGRAEEDAPVARLTEETWGRAACSSRRSRIAGDSSTPPDSGWVCRRGVGKGAVAAASYVGALTGVEVESVVAFGVCWGVLSLLRSVEFGVCCGVWSLLRSLESVKEFGVC